MCEVLSPATAALDRVRKLGLYARAGIPHSWIVDPDARVVEALALRDGAWTDAGIHEVITAFHMHPLELSYFAPVLLNPPGICLSGPCPKEGPLRFELVGPGGRTTRRLRRRPAA